MEILLATHNERKKEEILDILPKDFTLKTFNDYNFNDEIEETGITFEENAFIKANTGFSKFNISCFADDSGLVIHSLNGEPGIYSSRYAGTESFADNIEKVFKELNDKNLVTPNERKAYFISVICLVTETETKYFEGRINGVISNKVKGEKGFGYDPIFIPNDYDISFGEMSPDEKNKISHRAISLSKFMEYMKSKI